MVEVHMRLTDKRAKMILDKLAQRLGYEGVKFDDDILDTDWKFLVFMGDEEWKCNELMTCKEGTLYRMGFNCDDNFIDALNMMSRDAKHCVVATNVRMRSVSGNQWQRVFKDTDCLESLMIECDVNG